MAGAFGVGQKRHGRPWPVESVTTFTKRCCHIELGRKIEPQ